MLFNRITIIGVGLLGGSLGLAARRRALAGEVVGYVRREASLAECRESGAVDRVTCDPVAAVAGADLVVFCTPLAQMRDLAVRLAPGLSNGVLVTDVGSVKGSVVRDLEPVVSGVGGHFVGGHPMAGGERSGVGAAREDLFENAPCVLTPVSSTYAPALTRLGQFWRALGSRVIEMDPALHDILVSRSSHLPHVVAAQLANYVLGPDRLAHQAALCATGFRDTTRVASGSPEMWRDIALANAEHLGNALDGLIGGLHDFRRLLLSGDAAGLERFFATAKQRRDEWAEDSRVVSPE